MKNILINFASSALSNNIIFDTDDVNGLNDPFKQLKKGLFDIGYDIKTADQNSLAQISWVFFIDGESLGETSSNVKDKLKVIIKNKLLKRDAKPARKLYQECLKNGLKEKIVLFLWECKAVKPENYSQKLYDKFPIVLTWNDDLVDNKKFFKFYLPCPTRKITDNRINFSEKKFLINISANKLTRFPNELYSGRRKSIKFFENKLGEQFDLFGPRWNSPINRFEKIFPFLVFKYKNYRGVSKDKMETLPHYKFSLCYENAYGLNGYITEKIFDCFNALTVPIYWGAENVTQFIDKETFIDRRKFRSDEELLDFLQKINETEYNKYLSAIEKYLAGDKYKLFLSENFADTIIKALNF